MMMINFSLLLFLFFVTDATQNISNNVSEEDVLQSRRDDLVFHFENDSISLKDLFSSYGETPPWTRSEWETMKNFSCQGKCHEKNQRSRVDSCYCDDTCLDIGDCCYDYAPMCTSKGYWTTKSSNYRCIEDVLVIKKCPHKYYNHSISGKCMSTFYGLERIPVFDKATKKSFQNIYCAQCHRARQPVYWNTEISVVSSWTGLPGSRDHHQQSFEEALAQSSWLEHKIFFHLTDEQKRFSRNCISTDTFLMSNSEPPVKGNLALCRDICLRYALPLEMMGVPYRNPHCYLYFKIITIKPPSPPKDLTRIFTFSSNSDYTVTVDDQREYHFKNNKIVESPSKKREHLSPSVNASLSNGNSLFNGSSIQERFSRICSHMMSLNISDVLVHPNQSIQIRSTDKIFPNGSYFISQSKVLVCMTGGTRSAVVDHSKGRSLQILTYVGYSLSFLAEIVLLLIYSCVAELRNRPGKIVMTLTSCLLVYQVLFVLAGYIELQWACAMIAALFHYFLLTCFAWMSVMALDVMVTFAFTNQSPSGKTFPKYCCYAFGLPLAIVVTSVILDKTRAVTFGYGIMTPCWIAGQIPGVVTVDVPVGILIVFDLISITVTAMAIRVTKRESRMARSRGSGGINTPFLCLKLVFIMGVPWMLGLLVAFVDSTPLKYIYVILNSLQGFFIGLLFTATKRTIASVRKRMSPNINHSTDTSNRHHQGKTASTNV